MTIDIRIGTNEDAAEIDVFDPFGGDRKAELDTGRCWVAVSADEVVAFISLSAEGLLGRPFVSYMAVAPQYRRRGIATRLIESVKEGVGSDRVFISTEENNLEMRSLLSKLCWVEAGEIRGANRDGVTELYYYQDL